MSMISCPECGTHISDKAFSCPFCGFSGSSKDVPIGQQQHESTGSMESSLVEIEYWDPTKEVISHRKIAIDQPTLHHIFEFFGNWERIQTIFPALAQVIRKMAFEDSSLNVEATVPAYIKKLIDDGTLHFARDKNNQVLPVLMDKNNTIRKQIRLHQVDKDAELIGSLQHLETQAAISAVLNEIQNVETGIEQIGIGLQNDRLAKVESTWEKFSIAQSTYDSRLRNQLLLETISTASESKYGLMRQCETDLEYIREHEPGKGHAAWEKDESSAKALEILNDLISIMNMVRVQVDGFNMLGEQDDSIRCLESFNSFVVDNELDERNTFVRLNGNLETKDKISQTLIDEFPTIVKQIVQIGRVNKVELNPAHLNELPSSESQPIQDEKLNANSTTENHETEENNSLVKDKNKDANQKE
ncbi:zinc ribbon domain-containing protein [Bifidobacterium sp. ESL0732]|uniref:zinc ribbon domain-containing protein n=1 Tax=Bifidobacterium sp. ESL0732 TaxID=2983222 RepID=UPI0023F757D8|nr:zinc ribbon domain-containing protein [Bifidobacterium sp. ESL0732]WEV63279.1 zinc ribbon domain-containing protein [Bifidobacterium sp. ESL0732]